jgi:hypothetical protein
MTLGIINVNIQEVLENKRINNIGFLEIAKYFITT